MYKLSVYFFLTIILKSIIIIKPFESQVIYGDEENERFYDEHYFRKQELRELKLLQKQEQKQFQDLAFKNQLCKEQQDKRFDQEKGVLLKNYENDLQSMVDQQKKQVDKAEEQQHVDIKVSKFVRGLLMKFEICCLIKSIS